MKLSICAKLSHIKSFCKFRGFRTIFAVLVLLWFLPAFNSTPVYPATLNDTQVIKSDHWIYDAVYTLFTRSGQTCPASSFPITVGELKFLLKQIGVAELDNATSRLYNEVYSFLYDDEDLIGRFLGNSAGSGGTDAGARTKQVPRPHRTQRLPRKTRQIRHLTLTPQSPRKTQPRPARTASFSASHPDSRQKHT